MATEELVNSIVDYQIDLEDSAVDKMPQVQARTRELLDNPKERNKGIIGQFLTDEIEQSVSEGDREEFAVEYWGQIADFLALSWEELNSIPIAERGDKFFTARDMMVAVVSQQARIESSLMVSSLVSGADFASDNEDEILSANPEELGESLDLKNQMMDKRMAAKNGV